MSAKIHQTVLRIPCDKCGVGDPWEFAALHEDCFAHKIPGWAVAPTEKPNIDYILYEEVRPDMDPGGRCRALDPAERIRYSRIFEGLLPEVSMDDVMLVDYCWYDSIEAPDYYVPVEM